jgi:hypothetical protein
MNIEEFVSETLVQITKGVMKAQKELASTGTLVNPEVSSAGKPYGVGVTAGGELVGAVDFDVAVVAREGQETKGGLGVAVGVFSLGAAGKSDATGSSTFIVGRHPSR